MSTEFRFCPLRGRFAALSVLLLAAMVLLQGFSAAGVARERVPRSLAEMKLTFAPVVKKAKPAVVNVYAKKIVRVRSPLFDDPFFRRFFDDDLFFGRPRERVRNSLGSGVIITPTGFIVTNNHVIRDADDIRVVLSDRREFRARLILRDERTDLALLKIDAAEKLPYLKIGDSDALEVGDIVLAIGNPFGVGQTVTQGIVSATARTGIGKSNYQFFIQTDAAINPGNSGGALVDMKGELVGINTMIFSRSGGSNGIGFAIPSNMVKTLIANVREGGRIVRPWAGVYLQAVTPDIAESLGLKRPGGALVVKLHPLSPLKKAGVRRGDVIVAVDGHDIGDVREFGYRYAGRPVGRKAHLSVMRNDERMEITVSRVAPPETPPRNETVISGLTLFTGLKVANLNPAVIDELGLRNPASTGVVIVKVLGGPAARAGFRTGDIILEVNGEKIRNVKELKNLLASGERIWQVAVDRRGRIMRLRR